MLSLYKEHSTQYKSKSNPGNPFTLQLLKMTKAQIRDEIQGARSFLAGCGIPARDVVGMRAPYLETKPEVRQILHSNDYLYDRCDCKRRQAAGG